MGTEERKARITQRQEIPGLPATAFEEANKEPQSPAVCTPEFEGPDGQAAPQAQQHCELGVSRMT
jgi:hypothetical protein